MRVGMGDRDRTISMAHPGSRSSRKGGSCQFVRASVDSALCCVRPLANRGRRRRTYGGIESAHTLAPAPRFSLMNRPTNLFARMSRAVISIGAAASILLGAVTGVVGTANAGVIAMDDFKWLH